MRLYGESWNHTSVYVSVLHVNIILTVYWPQSKLHVNERRYNPYFQQRKYMPNSNKPITR